MTETANAENTKYTKYKWHHWHISGSAEPVRGAAALQAAPVTPHYTKADAAQSLSSNPTGAVSKVI